MWSRIVFSFSPHGLSDLSCDPLNFPAKQVIGNLLCIFKSFPLIRRLHSDRCIRSRVKPPLSEPAAYITYRCSRTTDSLAGDLAVLCFSSFQLHTLRIFLQIQSCSLQLQKLLTRVTSLFGNWTDWCIYLRRLNKLFTTFFHICSRTPRLHIGLWCAKLQHFLL